MNKTMNEIISAVVSKGFTVLESGSEISLWAVKGNIEINVGFHYKKGTITLDTFVNDEKGCHCYYNPTIYLCGTRLKSYESMDLEPTAENMIKILDEMEYMQEYGIKLYIEEGDTRKRA